MNNDNYDQELNNKELEKLLKLKKRQIRIDIVMLVLIIFIIVLLLLNLFKKCTCNCCEGCSLTDDVVTEMVPNNIIKVIVQDTDEPSGRRDDGENVIENIEDDTHEQHEDLPEIPDIPQHEDDTEVEIKLSERDQTHTENRPFDVLFAPGDSETKKYAVEVTHKETTNLFFSLTDVDVYDDSGTKLNINTVMSTANSVLDIIDIKVVVEGIEKYSGAIKGLINNEISYYINSTNSTDTVEFIITPSIASDVSDNYSDNSDGNYQNMMVNFSLKWWIE